MLYRAQNICAQTDEVCVFLERALCCTEHRISVHKLMKCVYFWRGPCGSVCFWRGPCGSVCVSGEGLVEVCVFLERALWKCVCVSGEGLVEVCVFLERALWKCVCFWREPCVVQICIPVQPCPAAESHHCVWLHLQDGH